MAFTFKTKQPEGKWKSFYKPTYHIKLNKKEVGLINADLPHKIRLQIIKTDLNEDGNPNCSWKWITLKKESSNLQEAKDFLNSNFEAVLRQYNLHLQDD